MLVNCEAFLKCPQTKKTQRLKYEIAQNIIYKKKKKKKKKQNKKKKKFFLKKK